MPVGQKSACRLISRVTSSRSRRPANKCGDAATAGCADCAAPSERLRGEPPRDVPALSRRRLKANGGYERYLEGILRSRASPGSVSVHAPSSLAPPRIDGGSKATIAGHQPCSTGRTNSSATLTWDGVRAAKTIVSPMSAPCRKVICLARSSICLIQAGSEIWS